MILRSLIALVSLATASPALADYEFDPADLPAGYQCDAGLSPKECDNEKRFEAWYRKYDERVDYWHHALLFDTNIYFARRAIPPLPRFNEASPYHEHEKWLGYETPNLVDVFYSISLRRGLGWAFAINEDAALRIVRRKSNDEIPPELLDKYGWWMPTTLEETAEQISVFWSFEEADLSDCAGGIEHLRNFPAQKGSPLWEERALEWSPDFVDESESDRLIVTADGDGVFVRAKGVRDDRATERKGNRAM